MTLTRISQSMLDPSFGGFVPRVTSIAALKAMNGAQFPVVTLHTPQRKQDFEWLTGDYTSRIATDVYNGRYVKSDNFAAGAGAWVAVPHVPGSTVGQGGRFQGDIWYSSEFGVPRNDQDANADPAPYFAAMWNLANIDRPGTLKIDLGLYTLSARFPTLTYQGTVEGSVNKGWQSTGLTKNYNEADPHIGIMPFGKWGVTLRDLALGTPLSGIPVGGSAYSFILDSDDTGPGDTYIERVYVSALCCHNGMYIDGRLAVSGTAQGYRTIFQRDCQFLNSTSYAIEAYGIHHWEGSNMLVANTNGVGQPALKIDSDTVSCDNIQLRGIISGKITLGKVARCCLITPIMADVENTADTVNTTIIGAHIGGTIQSNWTGNSGVISPA